jgi:DNA-binding NtrC family response regulator
MSKILIVDDKPNMLTLLENILCRDGHEVVKAENGSEALRLYGERGHIDLVISDLVMPQMDGRELFVQLKALNPSVPFVMLTGFGTIKMAVEAMQEGAFDFVTKSPFDRVGMRDIVKRALNQSGQPNKIGRPNPQVPAQSGFAGIIGKSHSMQVLFRLIRVVANSHITVMIQGESGTGKELVAKAIHSHSSRKDRTFVALDCGAMPETLLESELFGHLKGSFTGAVSTKKGLLEQADGGTILLDEISNTSLSFQAKLLRALQESEIRPLGSNSSTKVNVRLIASSNRDLKNLVKEGNFREDLYYRLAGMPLLIPPLRERKEDIPLLVHHFIAKYCLEQNKPLLGISQEALAALVAAPWPGNVRELENVISRATLFCETSIIDCSCLSHVYHDNLEEQQSSLKQRCKEVERERIFEAIVKNQGNKKLAAKELGISLACLYYKIKEYQIDT